MLHPTLSKIQLPSKSSGDIANSEPVRAKRLSRNQQNNDNNRSESKFNQWYERQHKAATTGTQKGEKLPESRLRQNDTTNKIDQVAKANDKHALKKTLESDTNTNTNTNSKVDKALQDAALKSQSQQKAVIEASTVLDSQANSNLTSVTLEFSGDGSGDQKSEDTASLGDSELTNLEETEITLNSNDSMSFSQGVLGDDMALDSEASINSKAIETIDLGSESSTQNLEVEANNSEFESVQVAATVSEDVEMELSGEAQRNAESEPKNDTLGESFENKQNREVADQINNLDQKNKTDVQSTESEVLSESITTNVQTEESADDIELSDPVLSDSELTIANENAMKNELDQPVESKIIEPAAEAEVKSEAAPIVAAATGIASSTSALISDDAGVKPGTPTNPVANAAVNGSGSASGSNGEGDMGQQSSKSQQAEIELRMQLGKTASTVDNVVKESADLDIELKQQQTLQRVEVTRKLVEIPVRQPVGHADWAKSISDRMMMMVSRNMKVANIRLDPPNMGLLEVKITIGSDQQMQINFTSQHAQVREVLEAESPRLRQMLEQQGMTQVDVDVSDRKQQETGSNGEAQQFGSGEEAQAVDEMPQDMAVNLGLVDHYV